MAIPAPGFRSDTRLAALREADGPILFAHADLAGFSVFEEASWWGRRSRTRASLVLVYVSPVRENPHR